MQEVSFTAKDKLVVPADLQASISKEVENDPHKVETRMKQVQFGKNTAGYDNYLAAVPKYVNFMCSIEIFVKLNVVYVQKQAPTPPRTSLDA